MYARTINISEEEGPVRLVSGQRITPGWYMLRAGYNPADGAEYGGLVVYFASSGVSTNSADSMMLNPTEAQLIHLEEATEVLVARAGEAKARLTITEV